MLLHYNSSCPFSHHVANSFSNIVFPPKEFMAIESEFYVMRVEFLQSKTKAF